jgi:DNA-binding response OmpR family regulator
MNIRVMIVDDNEFIRESVEILFQTEGIGIVTAGGGKECLEQLEAGFRGILLMDVMMPQIDGWDTIRQIVARDLYDGNIVLMLTAKREPDDKMVAIQTYVTDYITKPFNPQELLDTVKYYATLLDSEKLANDTP